jgi:hypothetical protein
MATFNNDYLYDSNNDLVIKNGKLLVGVAENQYVDQILKAVPGNWRYHSTLGVNIKKYLGGPFNFAVVESSIVDQLKKDGYAEVETNLNDASLVVQLILTDTLKLGVSATRA